jgi:hypothetical protein
LLHAASGIAFQTRSDAGKAVAVDLRAGDRVEHAVLREEVHDPIDVMPVEGIEQGFEIGCSQCHRLVLWLSQGMASPETGNAVFKGRHGRVEEVSRVSAG